MEGKKIKGRKRHIATDVMGNLLYVDVHAASIHDTKSGFYTALGAYTIYPTIKAFCGDAGYRGTFVEEVEDILGLSVDIVKRNQSESWGILPKRWVVERTFGWMNNSRRLSKDYEITKKSSEAMVVISHIQKLSS